MTNAPLPGRHFEEGRFTQCDPARGHSPRILLFRCVRKIDRRGYRTGSDRDGPALLVVLEVLIVPTGGLPAGILPGGVLLAAEKAVHAVRETRQKCGAAGRRRAVVAYVSLWA